MMVKIGKIGKHSKNLLFWDKIPEKIINQITSSDLS
jgi:hypothetical protein